MCTSLSTTALCSVKFQRSASQTGGGSSATGVAVGSKQLVVFVASMPSRASAQLPSAGLRHQSDAP